MTSQPLKPQATIREYVVLRVLGKGSYGITYLATDTKNNRPVAIKEYFPMRFAQRDEDGIVTATQAGSDDVEDFDSGLNRFLEEAATLAGFHDENIVEVFDWFQYNGTAYVVMRYEEGGTLSRYLAAHKELLRESQILGIFVPLLKGLRAVHAKWFLHRDIKPENIYIRKNGHPLLIDFGTARHAGSAKHGGMTAYLTPGFAPPEQYDRSGDHGPWTDIYALGATMYYCITRITPSDGGDRYVSLLRSGVDPVTPATQAAPSMYSKELLEVIDWMMAPDHTKRPQSVDEVLFRLTALPAYAEVAAGGGTQIGRGPGQRATSGDSGPTVVIPAGSEDTAGQSTAAPKSKSKSRSKPKPRKTQSTTAAPEPEVPPTVRVDPTAPPKERAHPESRVDRRVAGKGDGRTGSKAGPGEAANAGAAAGLVSSLQRNPRLMYGAIAVIFVAVVGAGLLVWRGDETVPDNGPVVDADSERQQRELREQAEADREREEQARAEAEREREEQARAEAEREREEQARAEAEREREEQARAEAEREREEQARAEAERQRQLQEQAEAEQARLSDMLDQCSAQLASGPVTGAGGERALACYRGVLDRYPENETALDGVARIERGILDEIGNALSAGEYARAGSFVDKLKLLGLARGRIAGLEDRVRRGTPGEVIEDPLRDGGTAPVMVVIPAGSFVMGCDGADRCTEDQQPARTVRIGQPFLAGQFQVTFADYARFAAATQRPVPDDLGWGGDRRPVINVTWNDAEAYVEWLRDQTGEPYRLLSEAEWEYIARAGSDGGYFYGDDESELCNYGNHADANSGFSWRNTECGDGFSDRTAPVGTYSANDWRVFDVIGNVWEWVADCWHESYRQAPQDAGPWLATDSADCERRVIRGGSWYDGPELLLPRTRNWAVAEERNDVLGFRVAADVD
jgi:formylglycine-generating enzyme required for sulfatase activity/serine/threonine protein kinase